MIQRFALLLLLIGILVGCGGNDKSETGAAGSCPTAPAALASDPQLSPGFPSPANVTYTESREVGPSHIVEGYWDGDITSAYEGYKEAFDGTGYSVTKDEKEEVDAEVNFSGQGVSGQVKLLQLCKERTDVTITTRPS